MNTLREVIYHWEMEFNLPCNILLITREAAGRFAVKQGIRDRVGVMLLKPQIYSIYGCRDVNNPVDAVRAAASYLNVLISIFKRTEVITNDTAHLLASSSYVLQRLVPYLLSLEGHQPKSLEMVTVEEIKKSLRPFPLYVLNLTEGMFRQE